MNLNQITIRDYFAATASEADIQNHRFPPNAKTKWEHYSDGVSEGSRQMYDSKDKRTREQAKYAYADAMLAARQL